MLKEREVQAARSPHTHKEKTFIIAVFYISRRTAPCIRRAARCALAAALLTCLASAQSTASDPQAVVFAANAIAAMSGSQVVNDVTLTGNATWDSGNSEAGTVTLKALGLTESRIDLVLSEGTRTEIRDASTGIAQGKWINPNGGSGMLSGQNTMTDAVWFFPVLSSLASGSNIVLSYVGLETRNGQPVQHLRSYQSSAPVGPVATVQQLSTMDFYLDASSSLPAAVVFNQHPDNNAGVNIPIEVDYSDYQSISGVQVPMHIHKSMNGAPLLDITLTTAVFNSGLALSQFSAN